MFLDVLFLPFLKPTPFWDTRGTASQLTEDSFGKASKPPTSLVWWFGGLVSWSALWKTNSQGEVGFVWIVGRLYVAPETEK